MNALSKADFLALQSEVEMLELSIAQGQETDTTDARLTEIDRLMEHSDWVLCPDYGVIRKAVNGVPLQVCKSARGFYIGTWNDEGPTSRESEEYWPQAELAQTALLNGQWTQFSYEI